ncbi:neuromedin U receptor [Chamberlinius hualienensis]
MESGDSSNMIGMFAVVKLYADKVSALKSAVVLFTMALESNDVFATSYYSDVYYESMTFNVTSLWASESSNVSLIQPEDIFSIYKAIPMSVAYVLIFVTGVFGNVCTCIVIARNKHLHTATNYYLFSLAMSDLLLLILGLPNEIYQEWTRTELIADDHYCVFRGLAAETSTNASILTITAFTVERYVAICHPLRSHTMSKLSRAVKLIWFIWLMSALCALPTALQFRIEVDLGLNDVAFLCRVKNPLKHAFELSTFFFFCLPMAIISALYMLIAFRLRRSNLRCNSSRSTIVVAVEGKSPNSRICRSPRSSTGQNGGGHGSRRAVIKMLGE